MVCSKVEKPVFVETNFGTRLVAVASSPDITVKAFKRELERTHVNCFPEFGRIWVNALMVELKSRLYHLPESLPLKYAFDASNGTWFLQMDAHPQHHPDRMVPLNFNNIKFRQNLKSSAKVVTRSVKHKTMNVEIRRFPFLRSGFLKFPVILHAFERKTKRKNRKHKTENQTKKDTILETDNEAFSESVSVSGVIKKYFVDYDEVASTPFSSHDCGYFNSSTEYKHSHFQRDVLISDLTGLVKKPGCESSKKPEVGKRILQASGGLGLSPSKQRPALSLCTDIGKKSQPFCKSSAVVQNLSFELTEETD